MPLYYTTTLRYFCQNCDLDFDDANIVASHLQDYSDHVVLVKI